MPVNDGRNKFLLAAIAVLAGSLSPAGAEAGHYYQYRRAAPSAIELPPPEARGCYFERGRRFCGAYCYWEVNGKRYCQRRERDAHSQAPVVEEYWDSDTLK
ncbi:MAG: hypothetical protein K2Q28_10800 [Hyphomicrobium sp.]|nr:hypothetical protein [Hyphomicrobium sp.]